MTKGMLRLNPSLCDYCGAEYARKTHNQRYCTAECCRLATNERIMERYYERRDNRRGKERVCKRKGCNTTLSRYNDELLCSIHASSGRETNIGQVLSKLGIQ
jgi:hypothetical protein